MLRSRLNRKKDLRRISLQLEKKCGRCTLRYFGHVYESHEGHVWPKILVIFRFNHRLAWHDLPSGDRWHLKKRQLSCSRVAPTTFMQRQTPRNFSYYFQYVRDIFRILTDKFILHDLKSLASWYLTCPLFIIFLTKCTVSHRLPRKWRWKWRQKRSL